MPYVVQNFLCGACLAFLFTVFWSFGWFCVRHWFLHALPSPRLMHAARNQHGTEHGVPKRRPTLWLSMSSPKINQFLKKFLLVHSVDN